MSWFPSSHVLWIAALVSPIAAAAQNGGFIVKLGTDTISIERYQRSATKIDGTILRRLPQTSMLKYTIGLTADGSPISYEQVTLRADGSPLPTAPSPLRMTFTGDSVIRQLVQNGQPVMLRAAAPKGTLPGIGGSLLATELMIGTARRVGAVYLIGVGPQQAAPNKQDVRFFGSDSAEIVAGGFRTGVKLDASGKVLRTDGSLTTQKFIGSPMADARIEAIAAEWAAKDAVGQAAGAASTRDTVNAMIGGANVWIDYGRPAKRGREIWRSSTLRRIEKRF